MELDTPLAAELASGSDPTDAQFRLLVETVSDYAIYLLDTAGHVMSWNAGAERIKGYAAAEILGRHFSIFYLPEDRAAGDPDQMLVQAAREGRMSAQGWRLRREQILGRRDDEVFPGQQAVAFAASDADVLARHSAIELEQAIVTGEGERIHMVVKFPVLDGAGAVAGIGGVATDITERKRS